MEGRDTAWQEARNTAAKPSILTFGQGDTQFRVVACNNDGV